MKKLDKNYLKKINYIVLGAALIYIAIYLIHSIFGLMGNMSSTANSISLFLSKMFSILAPAIFGFVFAYLFDPFVQFLQVKYEKFEEKYLKEHKQKKELKISEQQKEKKTTYKNRMAGTLILYLIIILVIVLIVLLIINSISFDSSNETFGAYIINTVSTAMADFNHMSDTIQLKLSEYGVSTYFSGIVDSVLDWVKSLLLSVVGAVGSIVSGLFTAFLGLVMGFYMLKDKDLFKNKTLYLMDVFIPEKAKNKMLYFFRTIHEVLSGYIRGQLMDACIYGTLVGVGLSALGVQFAPIIGLISGICNLIPYVGAFVAFVLSVIAALFSGDIMLAVYAALVVFILQQIDSIVINPRCVSSKIDISAFLVIFSLAIGGSLWGLFGMLFAVPIAGILKIFLGNFVESQAKSGSIRKKLVKKSEEE